MVPLPQLFKSMESNSINQAECLWVSLALIRKWRRYNDRERDTHTLKSCIFQHCLHQNWSQSVLVLVQTLLTELWGESIQSEGVLMSNKMTMLQIGHESPLVWHQSAVLGSLQRESTSMNIRINSSQFSQPVSNLPVGVNWTIRAAYSERKLQSWRRGWETIELDWFKVWVL